MDTVPELRPVQYVRINAKILKTFIYWPPESNKEFIRRLIYLYYFLMFCFIMILYSAIEYISFVKVFGNLEEMIEISFLLFTNTTQIMKIIIFIYNSKDIVRSVYWMEDEIFKPKTRAHYNILKRQMDNYWKVWLTYMTIVEITLISFPVIPFLNNKVKDRILPFEYYYPYDTTGTITYSLTFIYQTVSMAIHGTANAAMDSLYAGMMAFVGAQIEILNHTLARLHEAGVLGEDETEYIDRSRKIKENLDFCVYRHWNILKFVEKLNVYIAFTTLFQFGMGGIILCIAMYSMSTLEPTSGEFISCLFYFMSMITQIAVYCWYGNEIMIKSDLLSSSIYNCDWTGIDVKVQKNILLFMIFVGKPSKIFAGYFIILSLNTFAAIIKAAWSYFAVLKNAQE